MQGSILNLSKVMTSQLGHIAILGFGSQGQAHAQNLRDSGYPVTIALREKSPHRALALSLGFPVTDFSKATLENDTLVMGISDLAQQEVFETFIRPNLPNLAGASKERQTNHQLFPKKTIIFLHGFSSHFQLIRPPKDIDVVLVAPKGGPGSMVRDFYVHRKPIPMLYAVHQDFSGKAKKKAIEYALAIGGTKKLLIPTTFKEETEADLFGEQAVQCGGMSHLVLMAFETLVKAGYNPHVAYFETLHELKLVIDLVFQGGFEHMRKSISSTAQWGDYSTGEFFDTKINRRKLEKILKNIQSKKFSRAWMNEYQSGSKNFVRFQKKRESHPIEKVGKKIRSSMKFSNQNEKGRLGKQAPPL